VLDVGCGGGAAGLPLSPPAGCVLGFDQSDELLAAFAAAATERGVDHRLVRGRWPDDAGTAPTADVVVCHHVAYNVPDLGPFAAALSSHARRRVVMELTSEHPRAHLNWLWPRFWGIERPSGPTADDAVAVLVEAGIQPSVARAPRPPRHAPVEEQVASVRRYLCLPAERDPEIAALLGDQPDAPPGEVVTLWWDGSAPAG
jgi:SAM-dependent methyltransferase